MIRIHDIFTRLRMLGPVHWIADPDAVPDPFPEPDTVPDPALFACGFSEFQVMPTKISFISLFCLFRYLL
jgi:hypothetical protein